MSSLFLSGLPHRFLSAALVSIPLVDTCVSYAGDGNSWRLLSILGWLVFATAWFLRPVVFSRSMLNSKHLSARLALISQRQCAVLAGVGLLVVIAALVGRYTSAG